MNSRRASKACLSWLRLFWLLWLLWLLWLKVSYFDASA